MNKKLLAGVSLLAIATGVWAGGDPWKSKPFSQWDEKDVMTVLQNSPWSKVGIMPQGAWHPEGTSAADTSNLSMAGTKSDTSNRSAGANSNQMGGTAKEMEAQATREPYNIFWWSSRTIREASARRAVLKGTTTQEEADKMVSARVDSYQILVTGQNMSIFTARGEEAFMKVAYLQTHKKKEKLTPTKVEFQKSAEGNVVGAVFSFPKTGADGEPTIAPEEKQVDFELEIGGAWLRTYFNLKQMADRQGEDL